MKLFDEHPDDIAECLRPFVLNHDVGDVSCQGMLLVLRENTLY